MDARQLQTLSGLNEITWRGHDQQGAALPGGVYLYRVESAAGNAAGRMMLLK